MKRANTLKCLFLAIVLASLIYYQSQTQFSIEGYVDSSKGSPDCKTKCRQQCHKHPKNNKYICQTSDGTCQPAGDQGGQALADCQKSCKASGGHGGGGGGTNYYGDKSGGNCHTNQYSVCGMTASQYAAAASAAARAGKPPPPKPQFPNCDQKYTFPYYYYDMYMTRAEGKSNVPPEQLEEQALKSAKAICDKVGSGKTWSDMGSPGTVTWEQMASIFKANNPSNADDCPGALVTVVGECQNNAANTGCLSNITLWQNPTGGRLTPDQSAKNIYTGSNYSKDVLCAKSPDKVPAGFISSGNTNWLGPFCHVNTWGRGFGWGGGQCAGGL